MFNKKFDLVAVYRVCPKMGRNSFLLFNNDKFLQTRVAFKSFCNATAGLKVKLHVLLINCPIEYKNFFISEWGDDINIIDLGDQTNPQTFLRQFEILSKQNYSEICAFIEDDYFWLKESLFEIVDLFDDYQNIDFVTPYDHRESYTSAHKVMTHKVFSSIYSQRIWRTVHGTTGTFFCRKSALIDCKTAIQSMGKPFPLKRLHPFDLSDCGIWTAITKFNVFNPFYFLRCLLWQSRYTAWNWLMCWIFCWKQILFKHKYDIWQPIPSLATHLVDSSLPPGIPWQLFISNAIKKERKCK